MSNQTEIHRDYKTLAKLATAARRQGIPVTYSSLWRYCRVGLLTRDGARVRLKHMRCGGTILSRLEWLVELLHAVADRDVAAQVPEVAAPARPKRKRHSKAAHENATREAERMGV